MFTIWTFDIGENKHTLYPGEILYFLKKERKKILLILQKKKILPLAKEEEKLYQNVKVRYICGKNDPKLY